ncbi:hypothetical protein SAMN05421640_2681 [Ekhidna lutea]|uniref:Uncharacterized protein n=1 Tax=Ekhidna lutea TaxID=447679 RepID=A0A239KIK0_EKHLU|nr:hypothetical protein [Ekhidna lutea]SNT17830.1 hypothetical protein SAMN05421640_2681 [Ekhidna lutea]
METHMHSFSVRKSISRSTSKSPFSKFIAWADRMDHDRLIILVATILIQGCVTVPFAMWSMNAVWVYNELQMTIITIGAFSVLVTNLAVMPMRFTIPTFIICTMAQIGIIVLNIIYLI